MTEPCENCDCGLSGPDFEYDTVEFGLSLPLASILDGHIRGSTDVDPADVEKIEICGDSITITVQ